jgi:glycosyltransferase involved in cell wall biosynthesis
LYFYGPSDNVPSVLKAADIYVCSSIAEASPISVWEAISMAKSTVTTNVGDVALFIREGESGFVVPVKNAKALAVKVSLLIDDDSLRFSFGERARQIAVDCLDIEICVKKHEELYRRIFNGT